MSDRWTGSVLRISWIITSGQSSASLFPLDLVALLSWPVVKSVESSSNYVKSVKMSRRL